MKLAKSPLIGERSGKRIGKTLNIVVKDVEEINMKKKHNLIDLLSSNNKIIIIPKTYTKKYIKRATNNDNVYFLDELIFFKNKKNVFEYIEKDKKRLKKIIENIDYLKKRINNTKEENQLYQIINNIILNEGYIDSKSINIPKISKEEKIYFKYESAILNVIWKYWFLDDIYNESYAKNYLILLKEYQNDEDILILDIDHYSNKESQWIKKNIKKDLIIDLDAKDIIIDQNFIHSISNILSYDFNNIEHEILFIKDFIQKNLKKKIGIIHNDRLFLKRLNSLLEVDNINIVDDFGWSLTTSLSYSYIKDVINFFFLDMSYFNLKKILLSRYSFPKDEYINKQNFLSVIEKNCENINTNVKNLLLNDNKISNLLHQNYYEIQKNTFKKFLLSLLDILNILDSTNDLKKDTAGKIIIKTIQSIIENDIDKNKYSYKECVNKLEDEIETEKFFINYNHKNIVVTDINHAKVENFDHLIVCSMSNKNYPKNPSSSFFYNSTIFNDFSLKYENEYNLKDFLQLLKTNNSILTFHKLKNNEQNTKSKYKEIIDNYINLGNSDIKNNKRKKIKLKHEEIIAKKKITYNDILNFNNCKYCYYLNAFKDESLYSENMNYGIFMHKILEMYIKNHGNNFNENKFKKIFLDFKKQFFTNRRIPLNMFNIDDSFDFLLEALNTEFQYKKQLKTEASFTRKYKELQLIGRFDLLFSKPCLQIYDFKFSSKNYFPSVRNVINGQLPQLGFYSLIRPDIKIYNLLYFDLVNLEKKIVSCNYDELSEARDVINETLEQIINTQSKNLSKKKELVLSCDRDDCLVPKVNVLV